MDMKMISNQASNTAASAHQHQNQDQDQPQHQHQQADAGMGAPAEEERKTQRQKQQLAGGGGENRPRPHLDEALKCPRCESSNTKFCYYNNYSLLQPRYFCKACRRYWTQGGSLRNVPVGGGCRKNKRCSLSSSTAPPSNSSVRLVPASSMGFPNVLPTFMSTSGFEVPHLSLPFVPPLSLSNLAPTPVLAPVASPTTPFSFMDILRGGLFDNQSNNFYGPTTTGHSNGMEMLMPPSFSFDIKQQHGVIGDHHEGVRGTIEGGKWLMTQHEVNNGGGGATRSEGGKE